MDTRDSKGRFLPGNPGGGRPKKRPYFEELVGVTANLAVTRLFDMLHSDDESVVIQASAVILDFMSKAYGDYIDYTNPGSAIDAIRYLTDLERKI